VKRDTCNLCEDATCRGKQTKDARDGRQVKGQTIIAKGSMIVSEYSFSLLFLDICYRILDLYSNK
jgi:hypothetical protein